MFKLNLISICLIEENGFILDRIVRIVFSILAMQTVLTENLLVTVYLYCIIDRL